MIMSETLDHQRYARHLAIPEVGAEGQRKLCRSSALLIGAGGLGSPAGFYLAAAGVGKIGIVDADVVDRTNLQRQILHRDADVGRKKVQSAAESLSALNPTVELIPHDVRLDSSNAISILSQYDIVIDGSDNFPTRYLVNDACVMLKKPNVHGSVYRFEGQASLFFPPSGPCYRCLYPQPPPPEAAPNCAEAGVLGVLPGIVGCIQAVEAIKFLLGIGETLVGRLLQIDSLEMKFRQFRISRDPNCPVCGDAPSITKLIDYEQFCAAARTTNEQQMEVPQMNVTTLNQKLHSGERFVLLDVREPFELEISRLDPCVHIPMSQVAKRMNDLDKEAEIAVICRTGRRSNEIAALLIKNGFKSVSNVAGGINAFAERIDPTLRTY